MIFFTGKGHKNAARRRMYCDSNYFALLLILLYRMTAGSRGEITSVSSCPRPRVGTCACEWIGPFAKVTCSGLNNIPETLPLNTTYLKITNGNIMEIPKNYFLPLKYLQSIELQSNKISKRFHLPRNIWSLDLRNNMLGSTGLYGMFNGLTKLKYLDVSYNPIHGSLIPGTFSNLTGLLKLIIKDCHLTDIKEGTFAGLHLQKLDIGANDLQILRKGAFKGIRSPTDDSLILYIERNNISYIEDGTFEDVKTIRKLNLKANKLTVLPDLRGLADYVKLNFARNIITDISSLSRSAIKNIYEVTLYENRIFVLPNTAFKNISIIKELNLADNQIKEIPPRFLENSPALRELVLLNNQIETIHEDSFKGLQSLRGLFLSSNRLEKLPDGVFANLSLKNLFLNGNSFNKLTGRQFKGMTKTNTAIYLFGNDIQQIDDSFLNDLGNETTIAVRCQKLKALPHIQLSSLTRITCTPYYLGWIRKLNEQVAYSLARSGFHCKKISMDNVNCIPCETGSFQEALLYREPCTNCSAGGFYQDEMAQVECKECSIGTFVHPRNAPGTSPLSCQACPQGTQSSEKAGYRACKCLPNFYRFDRFGRCLSCPGEAFKCKNDYVSLSKGFYWEWTNRTDEKMYNEFIENLMIETREFAKGTWKYEGTLPRPHKCPRDSCLGGLDSSCKHGYRGPLCVLCEPHYFDRMNRCIKCPSRLWAGFQVAIVMALFVVVLLALIWGDRKRLDNEHGRTIADKILSCFKIIVGFYQVMAGVYSAFSDISWPSSVIWMQKTLHLIQLNILQIAPLSCITPRLSFNVLQQFAIVIALNITVVAFILIYLMIRIAILKRKKFYSQNQIDESVVKTKSSCIRNICVFLFATYPKTCTSIIQVLSVNCVQLCFNEEHEQCYSYLRSDLSVQCHTPEYNIYSHVAVAACLLYPIGFPVVILILVWKYIHKPSRTITTENQSVDRDEDDEANAIESPFKSGLSLFSENYRSNCWYWEALEMIRKLVLISGLTLIGEHSRTQIGLGAIISAVFAILYVYKRPINNKFENLLQTVALMAIFLNLAIGVMLKASDNDKMSPVVNKHNDDVGVSIIMIIINAVVIGIVTVAVLRVIIVHFLRCCRSVIEHTCSCGQCCNACLKCCRSMLIPFTIGSTGGRFIHNDESRNALLHSARNT